MHYEIKETANGKESVYINGVEVIQFDGLTFYVPSSAVVGTSVRFTQAGGLYGSFVKSVLQPAVPPVTYKYVDSSSTDEVYKVTLVGGSPVSCTCKAWTFSRNGKACKHMLSIKG